MIYYYDELRAGVLVDPGSRTLQHYDGYIFYESWHEPNRNRPQGIKMELVYDETNDRLIIYSDNKLVHYLDQHPVDGATQLGKRLIKAIPHEVLIKSLLTGSKLALFLRKHNYIGRDYDSY